MDRLLYTFNNIVVIILIIIFVDSQAQASTQESVQQVGERELLITGHLLSEYEGKPWGILAILNKRGPAVLIPLNTSYSKAMDLEKKPVCLDKKASLDVYKTKNNKDVEWIIGVGYKLPLPPSGTTLYGACLVQAADGQEPWIIRYVYHWG
jgi:hypothetical protein